MWWQRGGSTWRSRFRAGMDVVSVSRALWRRQRAGKSRTGLRTAHHRPARAPQNYPQYTDNIGIPWASGPGRQGMCRVISISVQEIEKEPDKKYCNSQIAWLGERIGKARKEYRWYIEKGISMGRRPELDWNTSGRLSDLPEINVCSESPLPVGKHISKVLLE